MRINLKKNEVAPISGSNTGLGFVIGLQWDDPRRAADLDLEVFLLGRDGKITCEDDLVFYGTPADADGMLPHPSGSVIHHGDRRDGFSDGDDELIDVYFNKIPSNIYKLAVTVTIADKSRRATFGGITNTVVHIYKMDMVDGETVPGDELIRYELSDDFPNENAIIFGEILRDGAGWKFAAEGVGVNGGLASLCRFFGFDDVEE